MKTQINRTGALVVAVAALAFPALAQGDGSSHRESTERPQRGSDRVKPERAVSWIVKGEVTAKGEDSVTVRIERSNHHGRALRDREVTFDMSNARIVVRDVNGDGTRDLGDVVAGDDAKLQARRPKRRALAEGETVTAKRGVFKAPESDEAGERPAELE